MDDRGLAVESATENMAGVKYAAMIPSLDGQIPVDQAYIQGRELNMMDIQKWFFQKYMEKIKQQQPKPVP